MSLVVLVIQLISMFSFSLDRAIRCNPLTSTPLGDLSGLHSIIRDFHRFLVSPRSRFNSSLPPME